MKTISLIAIAATMGAMGLAAPALAAPETAQGGSVPYCSSNSTQLNLENGVYQQQLQKPGKSLDSLDVWNGCLKAIYTDGSGHTTTAFYDPDSLRLIDSMGGTAS